MVQLAGLAALVGLVGVFDAEMLGLSWMLDELPSMVLRGRVRFDSLATLNCDTVSGRLPACGHHQVRWKATGYL